MSSDLVAVCDGQPSGDAVVDLVVLGVPGRAGDGPCGDMLGVGRVEVEQRQRSSPSSGPNWSACGSEVDRRGAAIRTLTAELEAEQARDRRPA